MSFEAANIDFVSSEACEAGPILKWAGGKTQLLTTLQLHYPKNLLLGAVDTYIEPFVGGGAVFFDIANRFVFKEAYLLDVNPELVIVYNSIKSNVLEVVKFLDELAREYLSKSADKRQDFFYLKRNEFNVGVEKARITAETHAIDAARAALTIFLNRTCFNGLFRVNSRGYFNVPHGRYSSPTILFRDRLLAASAALQRVTILHGDFEQCVQFIKGTTFIYYDPPYRPVSKTAQFTSYAKEVFNDDEQIRLSNLFRNLHSTGVLQLLSNSDPTNFVDDSFFDELYRDFTISRIEAKRMINSDASKRGVLREILVRNY
jgi:DNA adenine methylase